MLLLLHRGYVRLAGFLLSLTLWLVVSYGTYQAGGFRGSTMSAYFGIILIAELLLGIRAGIILGALSIAVTGWMVYADANNLLPIPPSYATQTTFWVEFSVVVVGVVGLLSLVMNSLYQALERARRNEKELAIKVVEVQELAQKAFEANEFKTRLIARVSHELRTPLGAIMGMSDMLQQDVYGPLTSPQQDIVKRILNNSHALESVFVELLDQSQIESGQLRLKKEPFSPELLAQKVYSTCLPLAQRKGLNLELEVDAGLQQTVVGDEGRTAQILQNLVTNAIKFTEEGYVNILVCQEGDTHWSIEVSDTGMGMSPETQGIIFEPFRQADESSLRNAGGVGLGLAIVKQLLFAMKGTIHVESEVGNGSKFTVLLPTRPTW
jgi:signal transduction histidine kinase